MVKHFVIIFFLIFQLTGFAVDSFRFAFITDLNIQNNNTQPTEDLQYAINEINNTPNIDFIIIGGDVTESGDSASLSQAKALLNKLNKPYYITFGNHDVRMSTPEKRVYLKIFETDRFSFYHKGVHFIGFTTAPVLTYGVGHIAIKDINWVSSELGKIINETPVIATTHYPLQKGDVDNWFEITDILRQYNVQAILNGHYHRNALLNYDGLAGIVNRSTLRGKEQKGGYSIFTVSDSLSVSEKIIDVEEREWLAIPIEQHVFEAPDLLLLK